MLPVLSSFGSVRQRYATPNTRHTSHTGPHRPHQPRPRQPHHIGPGGMLAESAQCPSSQERLSREETGSQSRMTPRRVGNRQEQSTEQESAPGCNTTSQKQQFLTAWTHAQISTDASSLRDCSHGQCSPTQNAHGVHGGMNFGPLILKGPNSKGTNTDGCSSEPRPPHQPR